MYKLHDEFVQILHSGGNNWITISTVGMDHAHICVYDSLLGTLPGDTKKQNCFLVNDRRGKDYTIKYYANNQVSNTLIPEH